MRLSEVRLGETERTLRDALATIRGRLDWGETFPAEVDAEAQHALATVELPELDLLDIPFLTIDPPESMDLDQAMHLERVGTGYRVHYAIADVPAFVTPGGAVDQEAHRRGQTLYPPDGRIPLHPPVLSEDGASLLPGKVRGAYVWTLDLDADARHTGTALSRARVRSRERFHYEQVQGLVDAGNAPEQLELLKEIGLARIAIERDRGGANLGRPDQEVRHVDGHYEIVRRAPLPSEGWNAQISLLTGMAAAHIMLKGRVGILRTMPPPDEESLDQFRRRASALGTPWTGTIGYGEYLRTLDAHDPGQLAIMHAAASLFRGAGYTAFDGEVPADTIQSAVAAPYAHTTAPLRRLVDRFVLVTCESLANGRDLPGWVREALPHLPHLMASSDGVSGQLDHAALSAIEAAALSGRIGEEFMVTVISASGDGGQIQLTDPAVTAKCDGDITAGTVIRARLEVADIATGMVRFEAVA